MNTSQNIAVIGGAGFIGTVLVRDLLRAGHNVRILDIARSAAYSDLCEDVDVRDTEALKTALVGVDVIYNLAAEHRDDVSPVQKYYDVNVDGAKNIVAAAAHNGINTIIFTSTVAVYGLNADPINGATEKTTPEPFNDYGRSKLQAEDVFNAWVAGDEARSLVTLRLVATFGEHNRGNIYTLMKQIANNRFIMIGGGQNRKSVAYVENVAKFLNHALGFGVGAHLYNYADKPDLTTATLIQTIREALGREVLGLRMPYFVGIAGGITLDIVAKITGKKFPISRVRVQKFCANTVVNADKLQETDFKRSHTLEQGLTIMMDAEF